MRGITILVGIGGCLLAGLAQCAEPTYQGKPLSEWLLELNRKPSSEEVSKVLQEDPDAFDKVYKNKRKRDAEAIRQMGKAGLPTLLSLLGATSENYTSVVRQLKAGDFHEQWWSDPARVDELRSLAIDAFEILGTNADSAVPQLTKLLCRL